MNNKLAFLLSGFAIFGMLLASWWAWHQIPDTQLIPVHYDLHGTPDRYGGKFEGLLVVPLIAVGLTLLFAVLPKIDPRAQNLVRSERAYAATWLAAIALIAATHFATVLQALGWQINVASVVSVGVGILLAIIGNYLGKVRSNFSFGIRTPWTLSSEHSWHKTHRLGGWLFFLLGISCTLAALAEADVLFLILTLAGTISISFLLIIYSYSAWKADPERQSIDR